MNPDHNYLLRERGESPAYKRKITQAKAAKQAILHKIFDVEQYTEPASWQSGCHACQFWSECAENLWKRHATPEGITYEPLRCFAEHPLYQAELWRNRGERDEDEV